MDSFPFMLTNISILFFSLFFIASFPIHFVRSFPSLSDGTTLVSNQERFELGFFSPGSSKNRYVGIWYKKITVKTVVWVANRCKPINDSSGLLTINSTGHLVLLHQNKTIIWSTRLLRPAKKPILELLDSGNLVVRDENDTYLWQSFDHPCDTLLPEMKLGWDFRTGLKRELSAWKNPNDPCPGNLSYGFELNPNTTPEIYIWKGGKKYYRSGPWNGLRFSGVQELMTNPLYDFFYFYNDEELYYMFKFKVDFVIFARVVLNETTAMRERYVWLQNQTWGQFSSAPEEDCDKYGLCGANGNCATSKKIPKCSCLKGFRPVSQEKWDSRDWSSGCVRKKPLSCEEKHSDGFKEFVGLKLPDTTLSWKSPGLNISECKAKCLRNCSCMAYSNLDIRGQGSGCIIWFGDLMDIRQFPSEGQNLFVRFPHSELGGKSAEKRRVAIIVTIVGVVFGLLLVGLYVSRKIFLKAKSDRNQDNKDENEDLDLPLFDLATISSATNEFSAKNKLGEGGFGPVYKGTLGDGQEIAVKRLSKCSGQGLSEFKNEVILIAKLQHRNLVRLLGCCIQGEEKLLIYEYMPNKSLDFFIFDETKKKLLDWSKRFEIICGVARGILYLHQDSRLRIIHRDLKASNVLLDSEMVPKISDFGMAKTFGGDQTEGNTNRVVGTYGYMAPEYASDGMFSVKSDVFSFGILMLEIISGKKNRGFFNPDQRLNLTGYAWKLLKEANSQELIDECLVGSCDLNEALRCIHISLLCVQQCPEDRPSMSSVVLMLASDQNSSSLVQPKHPGFFVPRSFNSINVSSGVQESSSSTNEVTISVLDPR